MLLTLFSSLAPFQLAALLSILSLTTSARLNDWSKPCFQGSCLFDLPENESQGSVKIWGSPNAISDITEAAGWLILMCKSDALVQDVRLVCLNENTSAAGCDHLYQNSGPVDKIVRLPQNCGQQPFARVAKAWVPDDQTIPEAALDRIVRSDDFIPKVMALTLDVNFAAINPSQVGTVEFSIQGATTPGPVNDNIDIHPVRRHKRGRRKRTSKHFGKRFPDFSSNNTQNLPPIDISQDFPIISQSFQCNGNSPFAVNIVSQAHVDIHAQVAVGAVATGTIVPPKFDSFGLYVGINEASIAGVYSLRSTVAGFVDLGQLTLFQLSLPSFTIPGLLTIGPSFKIIAKTTVNLDLGINTTIDMSYSIKNAQMYFPAGPTTQSTIEEVTPGQQPFQLSVTPSVVSSAGIAAHFIPRFEFGINALQDTSQAVVFLDFDASAGVKLQLQKPLTGNETDVEGCASAGLNLNIYFGAESDFSGLFGQTTRVSVFQKEFPPLFQQCFGPQGSSKRGILDFSPASEEHELDRRDLGCPNAHLTTTLVPIAGSQKVCRMRPF